MTPRPQLRLIRADPAVRRRRAVAGARDARRMLDTRAAREARFSHLKRTYD